MSCAIGSDQNQSAWVVRQGLRGPELSVSEYVIIPLKDNPRDVGVLLQELGLEPDPRSARRVASLAQKAANTIDSCGDTLLEMRATGPNGFVEALHVWEGNAFAHLRSELRERGMVLEEDKSTIAAQRTLRALLLNTQLDDSTRLAVALYVLNGQQAGSMPYPAYAHALFSLAGEAVGAGETHLTTAALEFFEACHDAFLDKCPKPLLRSTPLVALADELLGVIDAKLATAGFEAASAKELAKTRVLAFSLRSKLSFPLSEDASVPLGEVAAELSDRMNQELTGALPRLLKPLENEFAGVLSIKYGSPEMQTALEEIARGCELAWEGVCIRPDLIRCLGDQAREALRSNRPLSAVVALTVLRSMAEQLPAVTEQRGLCVEMLVSSVTDVALCLEDLFAQKYSLHMNRKKEQVCVMAHLGVALAQASISQLEEHRVYECTEWRSRFSATTDLPGARAGRGSFLAGCALVSVRESLKTWELAMEELARVRLGTPNLFGKELYSTVARYCASFAPESTHGQLLMGLNSALRIPVQHGQGLRSLQQHFEQLCVFNRCSERYQQIAEKGAPELVREKRPLLPHSPILDDNVRALHAEIAAAAQAYYRRGDYVAAVRAAFQVVRENIQTRAASHGVACSAAALFEPFRGPEQSSLHGSLGERHGWIKIIDSALEFEAKLGEKGGGYSFGPLNLREPRDALAVLSLASLIQRQLNPLGAGQDPTACALYTPEHASMQIREKFDSSELRPTRALLRGLQVDVAQAVETLWSLTNHSGAVYHAFTVLDQRLRAVAKKEKTGSKLVEDLLAGTAPLLGAALPPEQRRAILEYYRGAYGIARNALAHRKQENQGGDYSLAGVALANYALHLIDYLEGRKATQEWRASKEQSEALLSLLSPELYVLVRSEFLGGQPLQAVGLARQLLLYKLRSLESDKSEIEALLSDVCVDKPKLSFGSNSQDAKYGRDLLLGIWKLTDNSMAVHPATTTWAAFEQLKLLSAALVIVEAASARNS